jgi:hypothetical protein
MSKLAGIRVSVFFLLVTCGLVFVPSAFAQTPLPPEVSQTFSPTNIPQNGITVFTVTLTNPNTHEQWRSEPVRRDIHYHQS